MVWGVGRREEREGRERGDQHPLLQVHLRGEPGVEVCYGLVWLFGFVAWLVLFVFVAWLTGKRRLASGQIRADQRLLIQVHLQVRAGVGWVGVVGGRRWWVRGPERLCSRAAAPPVRCLCMRCSCEHAQQLALPCWHGRHPSVHAPRLTSRCSVLCAHNTGPAHQHCSSRCWAHLQQRVVEGFEEPLVSQLLLGYGLWEALHPCSGAGQHKEEQQWLGGVGWAGRHVWVGRAAAAGY